MDERDRVELITRVTEMEQNFDEILAAKSRKPDSFLHDPVIKEKLMKLIDYYEHGQWLRDYESDERGELPAGLKRGVLSQDAVYNLLEEFDRSKSI